jgi:hypothetical protein
MLDADSRLGLPDTRMPLVHVARPGIVMPGDYGSSGQTTVPSRRSPTLVILTSEVLAALRGQQLGPPPALTTACAAAVRAWVAVIIALNEQVKLLEGADEAAFWPPDAETYGSQPGLGAILTLGCPPSSAMTRTLRQRQGPQELRRHFPDHRRRGQLGGRSPADPSHKRDTGRTIASHQHIE